MPRGKTNSNNNVENHGGIVFCLSDLENVFTGKAMDQIKEMYLEGTPIEEISNELKRDPDEIFIALFHQARQGEINKPLAYRKV